MFLHAHAKPFTVLCVSFMIWLAMVTWQAPGYFDVVSRPMDFFTIRNTVNAGDYGSWEELQDDLLLMFDNAMAYNGPETMYHQVALTMKDLAVKMVELGKEVRSVEPQLLRTAAF